MSNNYDKELAFAKQLAQNAKLISDKYYKQPMEFETKKDTSPVTIADKQINQLVIDAVQKEFPADGVLGEEASWHDDRERLWICDPIDGTIAFSMGEACCMFSIALVVDGRPVIAVTRDLANGELFWATAGGGAYRDGQRISVSQRPLHEAWLAMPNRLSLLYEYRTVFEDLDEAAYQSNLIHGGVFKGMLIAQGFADAVVYIKLVNIWDMVAVKLIVEEAGGKFTDLKGQEHRYDKDLVGGVIVTNGTIHDDVLRITNAALKV